MEHSILHIKAPHEIHIAAKVLAARRSISMNQYIIDLIEADMSGSELKPVTIRAGIQAARTASPKQKKVIEKAAEVMEELTVIKTPEDVDPILVPKVAKNIDRYSNGVCKIHGTPLDKRSKCLQKGCKYA